MNILSQKITPGMYLVKVEGPLSSREAEDLIGVFRTLSEQGIKQVVVSLIDVPFLDSRGLAALVTGYRLFGSAAHDFRLVGLQDQPRLVFELTGFDRILQIYHSVTEAVGQDDQAIEATLAWAGQPEAVLEAAR